MSLEVRHGPELAYRAGCLDAALTAVGIEAKVTTRAGGRVGVDLQWDEAERLSALLSAVES